MVAQLVYLVILFQLQIHKEIQATDTTFCLGDFLYILVVVCFKRNRCVQLLNSEYGIWRISVKIAKEHQTYDADHL